jgi:hypothetical protein
MAQVVSHQPLTVKAQVCAWVSLCGICDGQRQVFLWVLQFSLPTSFHQGSTLIYNLVDKQQACWWPQIRDTVLSHWHGQHEQDVIAKFAWINSGKTWKASNMICSQNIPNISIISFFLFSFFLFSFFAIENLLLTPSNVSQIVENQCDIFTALVAKLSSKNKKAVQPNLLF